MRFAITLLAFVLLAAPQALLAQQPAPQQEDPAPRQPRAAVPGPNAEPGVPQGEKSDQEKAPSFAVDEHMPRLSSDQAPVIGLPLRSEAGETLGTVENVILDRDGRAVSVVIGIDKLLGLAEDKIEVEWKYVRLERKDAAVAFVTPLGKDELRAQAKFVPPKRQGS